MSAPAPAPASWARRLTGLGLLALLLAWTLLLHHGLGPRPDLGLAWYSPRGFLTRMLLESPLRSLVTERGQGLLVFWTPALLLAGACWLATRSALLRTVAVAAALACGLLVLYALGSEMTRVAWTLFHWRASGTMLAVALVAGAALTSPWLAASWLRLGWPARIVALLPVAFAVVAVERGVTGTNPRLPFALSPWPAVQVFGLEVVGTIAASELAGVALGLIGLGALAAGRRGRALLAIAVGLALPAAWLALGGRGVLPFRTEPASLLTASALCAALLAVAAAVPGGPRGAATRLRAVGLALCVLAAAALVGRATGLLWTALGRDPGLVQPAGALLAALAILAAMRPSGAALRVRRRARILGTAALLMGLPLLLGQAWARLDYAHNRDVHAQRIIDALARYYEREQLYPETLEELRETGELDSVPAPRLGFAFLGDAPRFTYQAFGTSYLLEFPAPRWVQCAYNPPYEDEGEDEPETGAGDEDLGGSWSCPSSPPELW